MPSSTCLKLERTSLMYGESSERRACKTYVPKAMHISKLYKVRLDHTFVAQERHGTVESGKVADPPHNKSFPDTQGPVTIKLIGYFKFCGNIVQAGLLEKVPWTRVLSGGEKSTEHPPLCRTTRVGVQCAHEAPLYPTSRPVRGWGPVPCASVRKESLTAL
jgi:hypothetical protein